ncbi:MAG TPA: HNH endonuclease signature motif containing protein [Gemmataceae bacterium]|jgi:hypothetical protein
MNTAATQSSALLARARRLLSDHRTRAKRDGQVLDYSLRDLAALIEANPTCKWCRMPVGYDLQLDHLTPIARGGPHSLYNLVVSCSRCNALKGMLTGAEMEFLMEFLGGLHPVARADVERRLIAGGKRYSSRRGHAK